MKVFSTNQIRRADAYTIENESISSFQLMRRAGEKLAKHVFKDHRDHKDYLIFCGPGNNGGDGYIIARELLLEGANVFTISLYSDKFSEDHQHAKNLWIKEGGKELSFEDLPKNLSRTIIVDALFGSGLSKPLSGQMEDWVKHFNQQDTKRISIDMPSGLFSEDNDLNTGEVFKAHKTYTIQYPKLALFFQENHRFVGDWELVDIGLHEGFTLKEPTDTFYLQANIACLFLPQRHTFDFKNSLGHAMLSAGSYGKIGAAVLAAKACMRSGTGLLSMHIPTCGYSMMQSVVPEAMVLTSGEDAISASPELKPDAWGIGPGIGRHKHTQEWLRTVLDSNLTNSVWDADALNILAQHPNWMKKLPKGSILTPHHGEFKRLFGAVKKPYQRQKMMRQFAKDLGVIIILKGPFTQIALPNGELYFNSTGNPGMATAGSGDVLTGIITGLLAQLKHPQKAALLGVFIHGLAGDIAAQEKGMQSLIASDIVEAISQAFQKLNG